MKANLIDIFRFNRYLKNKIKHPIDVIPLIEGEGWGGAVDEWEEFFGNHPKAIFPHFMVNSVENTGKKLMRLDFTGFHLDIGMALAYRLWQARLAGQDLNQVADVYMADIIDYFTFHQGGEDYPVSSESCVSMTREMVAEDVNKYLILEAQQVVVTFNKFAVFSRNSQFTMGDYDDERLFIVSCRDHLFDQMGIQNMIGEWVSSFSNTALRLWMNQGDTFSSISERRDLFAQDIESIIELAKTIDSVDKDQIINPLDEGHESSIANWQILGGVSVGNEESFDSEFDAISRTVKDTLKGFFGYIELFTNLIYGYNTGRVTPREWDSVLENFKEFHRHCIE